MAGLYRGTVVLVVELTFSGNSYRPNMSGKSAWQQMSGSFGYDVRIAV
jgi:hypothetical protein